jgi:hypothetical protein
MGVASLCFSLPSKAVVTGKHFGEVVDSGPLLIKILCQAIVNQEQPM